MIDHWIELAHDLEARPVVRLLVGSAIRDWAKHLPPAPVQHGMPLTNPPGIPMVYDPGMDPGAWRGVDASGDEVASGRIGEPGQPVWYIPGRGFHTWSQHPVGDVTWML